MQKATAVLVVIGLVQKLRGKSVRPAVALSAFFGSFKLVKRFAEEQKDQLQKSGVPVKLVDFMPGFVASAIALGIEPSAAASLWVIWLWVRVLRFTLPQVPFAEVLVGSVAAGVNLSTFLWDHHRLAPGYSAFLAQCGGSNGYGLKMIEQIRLVPNTPRLHKFCHIIHPETASCTKFALSTMVQGMIFGAKIQFPLHVITHLVRFKTASLDSTLWSLFRAVAFLGAYPASAMFIICNWWRLTGRSSEKQLTLTVLGCLVGATLFVESPGRRREIAAFTFTHSVLSVWRTYGGALPHVRGAAQFLFCVAVGLLMTIPKAQPGLIQMLVRED